MKNKINNELKLDDLEEILSEVKNDPELDSTTSDVTRINDELYIVGIDEDDARIVRKNNEEKTEQEQVAIK